MKEADLVRPGVSEYSVARSAHLGQSLASAETCSGGGTAETVSAFPGT